MRTLHAVQTLKTNTSDRAFIGQNGRTEMELSSALDGMMNGNDQICLKTPIIPCVIVVEAACRKSRENYSAYSKLLNEIAFHS